MTGYEALIQEFRTADSGDPYGTCRAWWFSLCDYMTECEYRIPDEWCYRPGAGVGDPGETFEFDAISYWEPSEDDCIKFGNRMERLYNICKRRGWDY